MRMDDGVRSIGEGRSEIVGGKEEIRIVIVMEKELSRWKEMIIINIVSERKKSGDK